MARLKPFVPCLVAVLVVGACDRNQPGGDAEAVVQGTSSASPKGNDQASATRAAPTNGLTAEPPATLDVELRLAASDDPSGLAWEIAKQKGWFADAGVDVELDYYDYVPSLEAFSAGKADAVGMTNSDLLLLAASGVEGVAVLAMATSFGNDAIVATKGIGNVENLKGKMVGVELGFSSHALALRALSLAGLGAKDVEFVNLPSALGPRSLRRRDVHAIGAREPYVSRALEEAPGSRTIFSTRRAPGLFYHVLCVAPNSLKAQRDAWAKLPQLWQRVVDYVVGEQTRGDAIAIMARRAGIDDADMRRLLEGTRFLDLEANRRHFQQGQTLESLWHSTELANLFHVEQRLQVKPANVDSLIDGSLLQQPRGPTPQGALDSATREF